MKMEKVRVPFLYDVDAVSEDSAFVCVGESMTHQSFADECDINRLVERFGIGLGDIPPVQAFEVDFTQAGDFQSAMQELRAAQEAFSALPARMRAEFGNDAGAFVDAVSDPEAVALRGRLGIYIPGVDATPPASLSSLRCGIEDSEAGDKRSASVVEQSSS
jgi:hypothetical protein